MKERLRDRLRRQWGEFWYWYVLRYAQRFLPWLARKLPKKLKYYVVIDGMVTVEPNRNPSHVSGMQLLDLWETKPLGEPEPVFYPPYDN